MKTKTISIVVFVSTFFLGSIFFQQSRILPEHVIEEQIPKETLLTPTKITAGSKNIEENNDWRDEDQSKFPIKLIETGEGFHGSEINAKSGENWLGLFQENGKSYLEYTKIKVLRAYDPVIDDENSKTVKTGKSVLVSQKTSPIFLLKNAKLLTEGIIPTLYRYDENSDEDVSIRAGFKKEFRIGDKNYFVKAERGKNRQNEEILSLVIESGGISQTIHSIKYFGDGDYVGALYWAGDLDRDGKPDFYFSLYFHDNVEYKNLFLSSQAEKGKLEKKVATFLITGC